MTAVTDTLYNTKISVCGVDSRVAIKLETGRNGLSFKAMASRSDSVAKKV